ncbi:RNA polymerase II-associated protein 1 isoform X2 [Anthonomus grandis grandis]|uniref:RNA polymerase II-associated protein 1 isoform X2 n=1 Tax=Anthonomus grandis grandis TaxID=2921223 RepID=UPI00216668A2|nr:RNA polymerase II-associated protein 1 isoform X2 [Anthonomus grandis grandis]
MSGHDKIPEEEEDGEERELLRQQAEYYKQKSEGKITPAAKFIAPVGSKQAKNVPQAIVEPPKGANIQEQIANTFEAIPTDMKLPEIVERHRGEPKSVVELKFASKGFPQVKRRDTNIKPTKGSIFSQQNKPIKTEPDDEPMDTTPPVKEGSAEDKVSFALTDSDREQIHAQNLHVLNQMTDEEKLSEREKLLGSLDPALIQFLRDQRAKKLEEEEEIGVRNSIQEQNEAASEEVEVANELLQEADAGNWLNFDQVEATKLAWMKDFNPETDLKSENFEARFDFEGYLSPYKVEITDANRHLFHHGDEPERPGYSLRELLVLARSSQLQQRVFGLNTLANILKVEKSGMYDNVLDIPFEQVFFVIRVCLDENTPSVVTASLKAMRNLIYFLLDEACADTMMSFGKVGLYQPVLGVQEEFDEQELNDQQLAERDLVRCLVRTDFLVRVKYIVNAIRPPREAVTYILDILSRVARDKHAMPKIFEQEYLLDSLVRHFLPDAVRNEYEAPLPQMVKLLRILAARERHLAEAIEDRYHVTDLLMYYLYQDEYGQTGFGVLLLIESMRYLTVLVHQGCYSKINVEVLYIIMRYHFDKTDNSLNSPVMRQSHVAALFNLLAALVEKGQFAMDSVVENCFYKWITQFKQFDAFKCGHSQILASLLCFAAACEKRKISTGFDALLQSLLLSRGFNVAVHRVTKCLMLLNEVEYHKGSPNLPSLGATTSCNTEDHVIPVLRTSSCIPLLYCFSHYALYTSSFQLKAAFLMHPKVIEYVSKLARAPRYFNVGHWFSRCESHLILNMLRIIVVVRGVMEPELKFFYALAFRGLCLFGADQLEDVPPVLNKIVFCRGFFDIKVLFAKQRIGNNIESVDALDAAWKNLNDIREVYNEVLGFKGDRVFTCQPLCLSISTNATGVIPVDWIYTPLVRLYSEQEKGNTPKDHRTVLNCLRWILMCESYFARLSDSLSPTEKYVRLCCVFLGSDSLFLYEEVQEVLEKIFRKLKEPEMDFEEEISGLPNFKDFYNQLLQQYQGVSYGNKVFANALLYPLVKRHDVQFRKRLWSDFLGVVETCTLKAEEVWFNASNLIEPPDTDGSLRRAYRAALNSGTVKRNTVMHAIAVASAAECR